MSVLQMVNQYQPRTFARFQGSELRLPQEFSPVPAGPGQKFSQRHFGEVPLEAIQFIHDVQIIVGRKGIRAYANLQAIPTHQVNRRQSIVYKQVRQRTNCHERMIHHGLQRVDALLVHTALVDQQDVLAERSGVPLEEPVDEIQQGGFPRHGRNTHPGLHAILPHLSGAALEHLLLFLRFLAMERQESGLEALRTHGCQEFRAHRIAGVRRRGGVDAESVRNGLQLPHPLHRGIAIRRFGAEDLQEGTGVHRVTGLHGEGIVAVGDVGHGHDTLAPEAVHRLREVPDLLFQGFVVAKLIDLVDESGHPGPLPELSLHIREFHVAVGIDKAGDNGSLAENRFPGRFFANPCPDDGSIVFELHEPVYERLR